MWEKNENKQKRGRVWPIFKRLPNRRGFVSAYHQAVTGSNPMYTIYAFLKKEYLIGIFKYE